MDAIPSSTTSSAGPARPDPTTVLVCRSCRRDGDDPAAPRAGARLYAALAGAAVGRRDLDVIGVECLSVCRRPVTVGLAAAAKWTYVYGDFAPEAAEAILDAAALYGATADGLIPWKTRPDALKKGVVARIPPLSFPRAAAEAP